jgi:hypothetical protein
MLSETKPRGILIRHKPNMNYYNINMKIDKILSTQIVLLTTNNPITKIFLKINNVLTKL